MKTLTWILLLGALALGQTGAGQQTRTGKLFVMGSEPFTQLALEVQDGESYVLGWARDHKDLIQQEGKVFTVTGEEMMPLAPGTPKILKPSAITQINIEGDILTIQVEAQKDPVDKKPGWSVLIQPHSGGQWYVGRNGDAISTGRVSTLAGALERLKATQESPQLSGLIQQPFVDVLIQKSDGSIDRLRSGVLSNGSSLWRIRTQEDKSRAILSQDFTKAFLELMKEADPQGWGPTATSYLSREKKR